jgi:magnesium-transporting ATPase (P-type)
MFRKQNMKPLVYLVIVLGLASFFLEEGMGFRTFRPSTLLSSYNTVIIAVLLVAVILSKFSTLFSPFTHLF